MPATKEGYSFKLVEGAAPGCCEFTGPGMPRYGNRVVVAWEGQAETVCRMLARAFAAGQEAKAAEIRNALGAHPR